MFGRAYLKRSKLPENHNNEPEKIPQKISEKQKEDSAIVPITVNEPETLLTVDEPELSVTVNEPEAPVTVDEPETPVTSIEVTKNDEIPKPEPTKPTKVERHKVAGISFKKEQVESLGILNPDYDMTKREIIDSYLMDERIYQYEFLGLTAQLIEEPDNPHDSNAIKVITDGVHIGYIKKESCSHIKKLIKDNRILDIRAEIGGGKYKLLYSDYDDYGNERYKLERDQRDYYATIIITVRNVCETASCD